MNRSNKTLNALELLAGYAEHEGSVRLVEKPSEAELQSHNHNLGVYIAIFAAILAAILLSY
ncbi:MAG: hypothetical protein V3S33_07840 [Gammaproteobacteria bacterium]